MNTELITKLKEAERTEEIQFGEFNEMMSIAYDNLPAIIKRLEEANEMEKMLNELSEMHT